MSATNLKDHYTLLIPTYNRPDLLEKLLNYLSLSKATFTIRVLDSSRSDLLEKNSACIAKLNLNIIHQTYPDTLEPFKKFADGFDKVTTPFSSLCADDDIIFMEAIEACVSFLANNPSYGLAHGLYCDFADNENEIAINELIYSLTGLEGETPIERICHLMADYEATTYAVQRTDVARIAFKNASLLTNILAQELSSSLLSVACGKAKRLPVLYSARNSERFTSYSLAHPMERILHSPLKFFNEYGQYRELIFNTLRAQRIDINQHTETLFDVAHLRYISPYIPPKILNFTLSAYLKNEPDKEFFKNLWQCWYALKNQAEPRRFRRLRQLKNRLLPNFAVKQFLRSITGTTVKEHLTHEVILVTQTKRRYHIRKALLDQLTSRDSQFDHLWLISTLNKYI